ncbi:TerB family tellurite resistance protein [Rhodopirellula halodulae]|uniref:TerB family tellurite resistance protein n=1 Tax=Rhodopirellula halodulae TaxID=2894198 RepID=UPI001E65A01F|nr:TerB family tellurite resistance protein [Rhodopirellula sp. JC737]MCC9657078.1 TerB family tellurite resistance protein [Rhodopirellula sp. JC737]
MSTPPPSDPDPSDSVEEVVSAFEKNTQQHKQHLRNLVVMAFADGSLSHREVHLIADRCEELGLHESELEDALAFGISDEAKLQLPADAGVREALLKDLIRMMAADGQFAEAEKRLFALAAAKMNLTGQRLQTLIQSVQQELGRLP